MVQEEKDAPRSGHENKAENRSGSAGAAAQRSEQTETTGDPGRTPGKAEGVEDPEEKGNE